MDNSTSRTDAKKDPGEHWARPVDKIQVGDVPQGATNLNLEGRQVVSPMQGFGQLWQKTYRVRLSGASASPEEVMQAWKQNFPRFQPAENKFYPSLTGIKPGEMIFIAGKVPALPGTPSILPVASGVMVIYADEVSFTVMTPEGFPESGWNTFSTYTEDGTTVAQIQSICRATDPLYEFYFRFLGSSAQQENTWNHVLTQLAAHFDVEGQVVTQKTCLDASVQWSQAKNLVKNAGIRTVFYLLAMPVRWARGNKTG